MSTNMKETSFFGLFKDGYEADDGNGHRAEGNTRAETQSRLEEAQARDVEWVKPLADGPKLK